MDTRDALQSRTVLRFANAQHGAVEYTVQRELARGGSCIVYDGFYTNNSGVRRIVRIKECYPFRLSMTRQPDGSLLSSESDRAAFESAKARMRTAFDLGNRLFSADGLTNAISNTLDIYEGNHTVYIVSTYQQGAALSDCRLTSLGECIAVVRSAARAVGKIHRSGYLYLDLKPENIFVLEDAAQQVQLFDFDSLVPLPQKGTLPSLADCRISYTRGFSALEHQMGQLRRLGPHTDVYSVGAVLFSLIFDRVPSAQDCETDAVYDFPRSRFSAAHHRPQLWSALTDFFHRTLASYWADRYPSMAETEAALASLFTLADTQRPFLLSAQLSAPAFFLGRTGEAAALDRFFRDSAQNCLFLTGMGGIGKSALARWYLSRHSRDFDALLWAPWEGSVRATVLNDQTVAIHGVERSPEETDQEYFSRKLRHLRSLTRQNATVLVLDSFTGLPDEDFAALTALPWKILVLTRQNPAAGAYPHLPLGPLERPEDLRALFAHYCTQPLSEADLPALEQLIRRCGGHTLVLELLAKQVSRSHLTIPQAAALAEAHGISAVGRETVPFGKDQTVQNRTVRQILQALFSQRNLPPESLHLLQMLALFPLSGVPLSLFAQLAELSDLNAVNALRDDGWLTAEGQTLSLHPVIHEVVSAWPLEEAALHQTCRLLSGLKARLETWAPAQEYITRTPPAQDYRRLHHLLALGLHLTQRTAEIPQLSAAGQRTDLLYAMTLRFPREQEAHIVDCAQALLLHAALPPERQLTLYEKLILIYNERRDFPRSQALLDEARRLMARPDSYSQARLWDMAADLADARLDGAYETENQYRDRHTLLSGTRKAIRLLTPPRTEAQLLLHIKQLLSLAVLLLRTTDRHRREVCRLLREVGDLCQAHHLEGTYVERDYCMAQAWNALDTGDESQIFTCLRRACQLSADCSTPLDRIDFVLLPTASILFHMNCCADAATTLRAAISLCARHEDIAPYLRKKLDLRLCLLEVYAAMGDAALCRPLLEAIDQDNARSPLGLTAPVPPELRRAALDAK